MRRLYTSVLWFYFTVFMSCNKCYVVCQSVALRCLEGEKLFSNTCNLVNWFILQSFTFILILTFSLYLQFIVLDDMTTSYIQTRGSVPVFWEQPGVQVHVPLWHSLSVQQSTVAVLSLHLRAMLPCYTCNKLVYSWITAVIGILSHITAMTHQAYATVRCYRLQPLMTAPR